MTRPSLRASAAALLGLLVALVGFLLPSVAVAGTTATPYQDPQAVGYLGFCNQQGQQVTSGSTTTEPFAWRAVSSQPAPTPYGDAGRTAILLAFQPQQNLPTGEWSGEELTASSRYTDPAHPMAAATDGDESLADYLSDYPLKWNGLVQVRLYLGVPKHPIYSLTYAATDIQVTGNTWHTVDGGAVSCTSSGHSESIESLLLPAADTRGTSSPTPSAKPATVAPNPGAAGATSSASAGISSSPTPTVGSSGGSSDTSGPAGDATATADSQSSGHSRSLLLAVVVAAVVLLLAGAVIAARRRGRPATTTDSSVPPTNHTHNEGP